MIGSRLPARSTAPIALVLVLASIAACREAPPSSTPSGAGAGEGAAPTGAPAALLEPPAAAPDAAQQGLTSEEIHTFYHLDQGGELYPLAWIKALQTADGAPFLDTMGDYGFLPDPDEPQGLPVGMTVSEASHQLALTPMVGITCAACHVGEIEHQGRAVRVIGGPNIVDQKAFFTALFGATEATLEHPAALYGFIGRTLQDRTLSAELAARLPLAHSVLANCSTWEQIAAAGGLGRLLVKHLGRLHAHEAADADEPAFGVIGETAHEPVDVGDTSAIAAADDGGADLGAACPLEDPAQRRAAIDEMAQHLVETQRLVEGRVAFLRSIVALVQLPQTDFGPGRADDWDVARAQLFAPEWALPLTSPLSFPPIWNLDDIPWLHYDNNTNSVMQRNVGQALGTGAPFEMQTHGSTIDPRSLRQAEDLARKITPPEWPADVLGPIDAALADRGQAIFAERCAACHEGEAPGSAPGDKRYDRDAIGTDTNRLTSFETPLDGKLFSEQFPPVLDRFVSWSMANDGIGPEEAAALIGPAPEWRTTGQWGTRSLRGVWATAPYLHNGSVPTIDDLLRPASERPTAFPIGTRAYDPARLGYLTEGTQGWTFDTTQSGNANAGHEGTEFGTDLGDDDRLALIEFLKGY